MLIILTEYFENVKEAINSDHIISMEEVHKDGVFECTKIVTTNPDTLRNYCFKERMVDIVEHVEEVWRVRMRTK